MRFPSDIGKNKAPDGKHRINSDMYLICKGKEMEIIDSHTHLYRGGQEGLASLADRYGYSRFCALSIPCDGMPLNNLECLLTKKMYPGRAYAYGGMTYIKGVEPTAESHRRELELLWDVGFDGWKILESKPSVYRRLRIPLDGEVFGGAFSFAEEADIPVIWHAGDPSTFWSADTAPEFAVKYHWLCVGEGYPSLEQIDREVENTIKAHPSLRVTLAHLYFVSDRFEYGCRFLNENENVWYDITPGSEMFCAFLSDRERWREFFGKYSGRIVYGTDMCESDGDVVFGSQDEIVKMVMKTLTEDGDYSVLGVSGRGLGLDEGILKSIMRDNFLRRNGEPRPIDFRALERYAAWLSDRLPGEEKKRLRELLKKF